MSQWKLRILSGQHQGSEIPLALGSISIGSDDQVDDIVLQDEGVLPSLLTLDITEESINIASTPLEQYSVDLELVSPLKQSSLPSKQIISAGSLQFVLGQASEDLQHFNALEPSELSSNTVKKESTSSVITTLMMIMILGGIPGSLLTWLWFNPSNVEQQSLTASESLQKVRQIARHLSLNDVSAQWNDSRQQVILEGYIDTKEQLLEFLKRIDRSAVNYNSNIRTMTDIKEGVRFVLDNLGYPQIRISDGDTAGTVLLTGAIDDSSNWNKVERILETDVPGLVAWKVQLQKAGAYMDTLKEMLSKRALLNKVQLVDAADRIEVRGELNEQETSSFYQAAEEFRKAWGERPFIVLKSIPLAKPKKHFSLPIRSISLGNVPYVTLSDNIKYTQGSILPTGHKLESINDGFIALTKGEQTLNIQLKGAQHASVN